MAEPISDEALAALEAAAIGQAEHPKAHFRLVPVSPSVDPEEG